MSWVSGAQASSRSATIPSPFHTKACQYLRTSVSLWSDPWLRFGGRQQDEVLTVLQSMRLMPVPRLISLAARSEMPDLDALCRRGSAVSEAGRALQAPGNVTGHAELPLDGLAQSSTVSLIRPVTTENS